MLHEKFKDHKIILASQSPRRQLLLKGLDISFEVKPVDVEENFPDHLKKEEIALYL
jgi:septum formation protein